MIGNGPMMPGGNATSKVVLVLVTLLISGNLTNFRPQTYINQSLNISKLDD